MEKRHPLLRDNCENCGCKDDLEFFQFVHNGITLCDDCADIPNNQVWKKNFTVNWVKVDGEYFPSDLPVSRKDE